MTIKTKGENDRGKSNPVNPQYSPRTFKINELEFNGSITLQELEGQLNKKLTFEEVAQNFKRNIDREEEYKQILKELKIENLKGGIN